MIQQYLKYLPIFLLLLLFCKAGAQPAGVLYINADNFFQLDPDTALWKFKAGDDIHWAARDIDDNGWITTSPVLLSEKEVERIGFTGQGWFRLHVHVDSSIAAKPLLWQFMSYGGAELYIDGRLIRKFGKLKNSEASEYARAFFPPAFVLKDTGEHVIAVRYENIYYKHFFKGWSGSHAGFRSTIYKYANYYEGRKWNIIFQSLFLLISAGIFLALFLAHLVMYLFHKKYQANLIFSLFNLGLGVFFLISYISGYLEYADEQRSVLPLFVLAPGLSFLALNILVNRLFFWSKIRIGIGVLFLLTVIVCNFIDFKLSVLVVLLYLVYTILEAAVMVVIAVRRKIPGAKILSFGILAAFLLLAFLTVCALLGKLNFEGYAGLVVLIVAMLAVFSLPLSMSAYLAASFAAVNKDLKIQLDKVGELSQKTLEQEQEKQRILESQNENLEKQVSERTRELIHQQDALIKEKKKSDDLLLNILPAEVAEELKETGQTHAQSFEQVSVLFTDFVNFTQVSEQLSPKDLVQELHECFRTFDEIMERNSMEKIKTIGDAYLAVSGMPIANEEHAANAVRAAMEIIDYMEQRNAGAPSFRVRIGINSGSLVAGIVGVKKFAYDIWGDTVNMASRMESNSEAGRINISQATYELVRDQFICTHRGKINAKGKGEVDMYFVAGKM